MKKYLSLFIFLIAVVTLVVTGCGGTHGYGTDAAGDNPPLCSQTLIADSDGAIAETPIGASGLRLKAEAGTLEPGAKIIITVSDSTEGSGNEYLTASAKVYDIKAILESSTGSTAIISSEKSVLVTVPNDIPGATEYYLATRASSGGNWSFARINDTNSEANPVNASARMVRAAFGSEFYIALHNLNQQFALFAHKDSSVTPKKAIITAIDCEAPSTLKEKDGKYVEDLKVNVVLSANNATQLKNSDVILKYNYQNGNSKDAAIKPIGASLKNTSDVQAKAGSGNKYAHSFELSSFDKFTVNGEKINIEFTLNMTGVTTEEFAENYYIEVLAANDTNFEFLPSCFCNMTLKTVSSDIKFIKASLLQPEDGSVTVPVDQKDVVVQFPDEINWTTDCEALVKVTSTNANETGAQYVYKYSSAECLLFVERQSNFAPNAEYKVEISEGIMGVAENTMVEPVTFTFTTTDKSEPAMTDITVSSDFADKENADIKPSVEIAFSNAINWDNNCTQYVTITKDGDTTAITYGAGYDSSTNVLTITPESNLAYGTKYNVSVSKDMPVPENYQIKEDFTFSFTTVANTVTAQISSKSCTGEGASALYYPKAVFAITFSQGLELADADIKAAIKLDGNALGSNDTVVYDKTAKVATITFETPFAGNSEHTLSFGGMTAGDGSTIEKTEALSFKVMPNITASLTTPATATGVATNTSIVVELSAAVGEAAYSADNITIKDSDNNIVTLSSTKTVSEAVYTVIPDSPLNWLATYTVTVATVTIDTTTGQMVEGKEFTFCTEAPEELILQDPNQPNSESNPYLVCTANALDQVRDHLDGYFKQMADIDLTSYDNWNPIAPALVEPEPGREQQWFTGTYDGNFNQIKNLSINSTGPNQGLFGRLKGTVKNVCLTDVSISCGGEGGALVGYCEDGTILCCSVEGSVSGSGSKIGGIVGTNYGTVEKCCFDGSMSTNSIYCGGIAGICGSGHKIIDSYSKGSVSGTSDYCGGIIGENDGTIENCYSLSEVSETNSGTLVGQLWGGTVVHCFSTKNTPECCGNIYSGTAPDETNYSNSGYNTAFGWNNTVWNNLTSGGTPTLKWIDNLN